MAHGWNHQESTVILIFPILLAFLGDLGRQKFRIWCFRRPDGTRPLVFSTKNYQVPNAGISAGPVDFSTCEMVSHKLPIDYLIGFIDVKASNMIQRQPQTKELKTSATMKVNWDLLTFDYMRFTWMKGSSFYLFAQIWMIRSVVPALHFLQTCFVRETKQRPYC